MYYENIETLCEDEINILLMEYLEESYKSAACYCVCNGYGVGVKTYYTDCWYYGEVWGSRPCKCR